MADTQINSFFTRGGIPATDINTVTPGFPSIRIWEVDGSSYDLIVGTSIGSGLNVDGVLTLVTDGSEQDGFYAYTFSGAIGYDPTKKYLIRVDGGTSIPSGERYQTAEINPDPTIIFTPSDVTDIANAAATAVWEEAAASHVAVGTMGLALNQTRANTETLVLSVGDVLDLVNLVLKYDANRTKIDTVNKQMIVYDDDCTSILRVFQLLDSSGTPSTDSVCERKPIAASDGLPVCS